MMRRVTRLRQPRATWLRWTEQGFWAVMDQALFSGANFTINVLLARWLSPVEYGAFAVAYSVFLLLGAFHAAVLIEPMLVFGAGKYFDHFRKYLGFLIYGHWGLTAVVSLILAITAGTFWRFGSISLAQALFGLAIAAPFILLLWVLRQAFYVHSQPQCAATGGMLYLSLVLGGICGLYQKQWLSSFSALIIIGAASVLVGLWFIVKLYPQWQFMEGGLTLGVVLAEHRKYSKWSLGTAFATWVPMNIYYAVLPLWMSLADIGALRALMNLALPLTMVFSASSALVLPIMSHQFNSGNLRGLIRITRITLSIFFAVSIVYFLVIWSWRNEILMLIYGSVYHRYANAVFFVGIYPVGSAITNTIGSAFRAMERPDATFWSYTAFSLGTLLLGIPSAALLGVDGALIGVLISSIPQVAILAIFAKKLLEREEGS